MSEQKLFALDDIHWCIGLCVFGAPYTSCHSRQTASKRVLNVIVEIKIRNKVKRKIYVFLFFKYQTENENVNARSCVWEGRNEAKRAKRFGLCWCRLHEHINSTQITWNEHIDTERTKMQKKMFCKMRKKGGSH